MFLFICKHHIEENIYTINNKHIKTLLWLFNQTMALFLEFCEGNYSVNIMIYVFIVII